MNSQLWHIGRGFNSNSYLFNGKIDEVSFFNKALTDNEILAIYNAGAGINRTVAYDYAGNLIRDGKGYMYSWDTENSLKAINKRSLVWLFLAGSVYLQLFGCEEDILANKQL
ncbi:MAG: hypothetical protein JW745_00875 [Sedimentisphaerales bacterium]|nr:hypothetical protein [Sedimentisphaerales bacterium]MBN2842392.1 hypothetical protein [Sedimentisphaerales bacterium]